MVQVPLFNQVLRVAQPHVGAVGEAGNLQQVGEVFGLCSRSASAAQTCVPISGMARVPVSHSISSGGDAQRLRGGEQLIDQLGSVMVSASVTLDAGQVLHILVEGRHIVSENVELENGVVQRVKVEVGGDDVRVDVVRRVLDGGEVVTPHSRWARRPCRPGAGRWCA